MSFGGPAGLSREMTAHEPLRLVLSGPIARDDIPALCARARELLERCDCDPVVCDVGALACPDAATVDALARLQLTARRLGRRVRLHQPCGELQDLLVLMGLADFLPPGAKSDLEPRGQAE